MFRDVCLRSGDGFPDPDVVLDPELTCEAVRAFVKRLGWCPIVGSA
jgi:hypothetical protein